MAKQSDPEQNSLAKARAPVVVFVGRGKLFGLLGRGVGVKCSRGPVGKAKHDSSYRHR